MRTNTIQLSNGKQVTVDGEASIVHGAVVFTVEDAVVAIFPMASIGYVAVNDAVQPCKPAPSRAASNALGGSPFVRTR